MAASVAVTSLLAALAASTTSQLDCVCSRLHNATGHGGLSRGEMHVWSDYCAPARVDISTHEEPVVEQAVFTARHGLAGSCEALQQPPPWLAAVAPLVPWNWSLGPAPAGLGLSCGPEGAECECGAALAAVRALTQNETARLSCHIADAVIDCYSAHGLNETEWTAEVLSADHLRRQKLSQLLHDARSLASSIAAIQLCAGRSIPTYNRSQAVLESSLEHYSSYWRHSARLFGLLATHLSQLFIPLAFEHVGTHTNGQELHAQIKNMERVRDMLDMKLRGLTRDALLATEQSENYKIEEDKDTPGTYIIRRPLLSDRLLKYQERLLSFGEDFGALCEQQLPHASQVFGLTDALYSFHRRYFIPDWSIDNANITDEEWKLEDQSQTMVWVDTGCLQLLADALDRPRCPLEELPLEARQCRERLWRDLVERPPRPPVTSYLAYNQRAAVPLCLLAWMAANSRGVCQDVPFSVMQSVHDATCYFQSSHNQTCLLSDNADAICSVSRAVLFLKCRDFSSASDRKLCTVLFDRTGNFSAAEEKKGHEYYKVYGKATERTLSYKDSLNSAVFKYRYFKVDTLKPLEYTFVAVNVLFRLSTASVYVWLPHLGNLPGKILLSFQLTGLAQVLCSEVVYRMLGFPDLSTAALVDSCLTLLGCLWLNSFCFQMYACVRDLRLPDQMTPAEASYLFRRQLRRVLIPWAIVSTVCAALEKSSEHYLIHSRITLIIAISSSIALNLLFLGLVGFIYCRNWKSMTPLSITCSATCFRMSLNTIILSGICVMIRIGFHQAEGLSQYVYYVHMSTMLLGPVLFASLVCNGKTLPPLRNRVLALWRPDVYSPELELGSVPERNLARSRGEEAETAL